MPNLKSAERQVRLGAKRRERNKAVQSEVKSSISRAEALVASGEAEAKNAVAAAVSSLDKAAEKGIIHPNNAARRKSRLIKKMNKGAATPSGEKKQEQAG